MMMVMIMSGVLIKLRKKMMKMINVDWNGDRNAKKKKMNHFGSQVMTG